MLYSRLDEDPDSTVFWRNLPFLTCLCCFIRCWWTCSTKMTMSLVVSLWLMRSHWSTKSRVTMRLWGASCQMVKSTWGSSTFLFWCSENSSPPDQCSSPITYVSALLITCPIPSVHHLWTGFFNHPLMFASGRGQYLQSDRWHPWGDC